MSDTEIISDSNDSISVIVGQGDDVITVAVDNDIKILESDDDIGGGTVIVADTPTIALARDEPGIEIVVAQDEVVTVQSEGGPAGPQGPPGPAGLPGRPGTTGAPIIVAAYPPIGAPQDTLWWGTLDGMLWLNYWDGNSLQWVAAVPNVSTNWDLINDKPPTFPADPETIDDRVAGLLKAGSNITLTYDDTGNALTIASTASGGGFPSDISPAMDSVAAPGVSALYSRGDHVHPSDITKAPLESPAFTGNPTAPTPLPNDDDTSIATTGFVSAALSVAAGRAATVYVSDAPPASAPDNSLWWQSDQGDLWIKFNDGSSTQWVMATPAATGGVSEAPIDAVAYGRRDASWVHVLMASGDIVDGGNF